LVEETRRGGLPEFQAFGLAHDADRHHVIQYSEPPGGRSLGRDLLSDPFSREPLLQAASGHHPTVGPREPLPTTGHFGGADNGGLYRVYMPVRGRITNRPTIDGDNIGALIGTLRMTVVGEFFLESVLQDSALELELYDGEVAPDALMGANTTPAERTGKPVARARSVDVFGRQWILVPRGLTNASEPFVSGPRMALLIGCTLSLCLFGFVWSLHRGRRRALRLVEDAHRSLQASEARFRSVVQHAFDLVWIEDDEGRPTYVSPSIQHMLGWSPEQVVEQGLASIIPAEDQERAARERALRRTIDGSSTPFELRLNHRDGTWRDVVAVSTNLLDDPDVAGVVYNAHDITERKAAEVKLEYQASHDPLTGLPNRAILLDALERALARDDREPGRRTAVLFMDLDGFKVVNDSLGHDAGDELLGAVAQRVRDTIRPQDVVARFGGDEFVIVCDPVESRAEAEQIAVRVREAVGRPSVLGGVEVRVSGSIGIALSSVGVAAEKLLRDADAAMYLAKDRGRNRHEVHADPVEARP
jgi:diguanylate cyclase (GGDEF)-like protein/PAS domain S-box-containing protein